MGKPYPFNDRKRRSNYRPITGGMAVPKKIGILEGQGAKHAEIKR